jgi:hypothetical protein
MVNASANAQQLAAESPTAWFAVLERARLTGDYERAAEAVRNLKRLGVQVQFVEPGEVAPA